MKYCVDLKTIVRTEIEADSVEAAIQEAKEQVSWNYFNWPDDWDVVSADEKKENEERK